MGAFPLIGDAANAIIVNGDTVEQLNARVSDDVVDGVDDVNVASAACYDEGLDSKISFENAIASVRVPLKEVSFDGSFSSSPSVRSSFTITQKNKIINSILE